MAVILADSAACVSLAVRDAPRSGPQISACVVNTCCNLLILCNITPSMLLQFHGGVKRRKRRGTGRQATKGTRSVVSGGEHTHQSAEVPSKTVFAVFAAPAASGKSDPRQIPWRSRRSFRSGALSVSEMTYR